MDIKKWKLGKYRLRISGGTVKTDATNHFMFECWYKHFPEFKFHTGFRGFNYTWLMFSLGYKNYHFHFQKTPMNRIKPYITFYKIESFNPVKIKRYIGGR